MTATDIMPARDRPGPVKVLWGNRVSTVQDHLGREFAELASRLSGLTDTALGLRLKAYDNFDRLTFGRAISVRLTGRDLGRDGPPPEAFHPIRADDPSDFPDPLGPRTYPGVWDALQSSIDLLRADVRADEQVFVSLYCHRVLVRPGGAYSGFSHRDNQPGQSCGTCVWYPRVDATKLAGAMVFCRWPEAGDRGQSEWLDRQLTLPTAGYHRGLLLMRYPHNVVHGVTPGRHRLPVDPGRTASVRDFVLPNEDDFIKDLLIVTVSEAPNAED